MMMSTARIGAGSILRESMSQASQLSPELARGLLQFARGLLAAARNWTLYPPDHPTVKASVSRLSDAIKQTTGGAIFSIGITPQTLLIEDAAADQGQTSITEAAAMLHDHDLIRLTFVGAVPDEAVHSLLQMLSLDLAERRARGGPAKIWETDGHASIQVEQIDYASLLARQEGDVAEPARRDDLWKSIVLSITNALTVFDEAAQQRILAIAGSAPDIGDLATAVAAPRCTIDGSPMITSQAAAVLAAYRHLTNIVSAKASERMPEVMSNLATASLQLDPHVVMQVLQSEDDPKATNQIVKGLAAAFDDTKVAQLLATALAIDGQASDRLATIFNTIAPDEDRKQRVMTMTRSMLSETDFGKVGQFQTLWSSMEELLVSYNDKPFVSETYRSALDGVGGRAERMAVVDLPPELPEWMTSLGQESVRALSVQMLVDLMTIETDAKRAGEIADDLEALGEDLLMAGAYEDTKSVVNALIARATTQNAIGRDRCRQALDRLGDSLAMRETAVLIGEVDEPGWDAVRYIINKVGAATIPALIPAAAAEKETLGTKRVSATIIAFGKPAVSRLAPLISDDRWYAQLAGANILGAIASPEAVPLLQPLLRKTDPRVAQAAVAALGKIDDPTAARAVQTVLRAATGSVREAVMDALVADKDPRVVPMLARVIGESEPLGKDHEVVLQTIDALASVGSDAAVPTLVTMAKVKKFFGGKKVRDVKEHAVDAMIRIGGTKATAAMNQLAQAGDRGLKKILSQKRR
jgi:hypothetical protein